MISKRGYIVRCSVDLSKCFHTDFTISERSVCQKRKNVVYVCGLTCLTQEGRCNYFLTLVYMHRFRTPWNGSDKIAIIYLNNIMIILMNILCLWKYTTRICYFNRILDIIDIPSIMTYNQCVLKAVEVKDIVPPMNCIPMHFVFLRIQFLDSTEMHSIWLYFFSNSFKFYLGSSTTFGLKSLFNLDQ